MMVSWEDGRFRVKGLGLVLGLYWACIGFILGLCWVYLGFYMGLYWVFIGFKLALYRYTKGNGHYNILRGSIGRGTTWRMHSFIAKRRGKCLALPQRPAWHQPTAKRLGFARPSRTHSGPHSSTHGPKGLGLLGFITIT